MIVIVRCKKIVRLFTLVINLGITSMRLLTNNPAKRAGLEGYGLSIVERIPIEMIANVHNAEYLRTKVERMGHAMPGLELLPPTGSEQ